MPIVSKNGYSLKIKIKDLFPLRTRARKFFLRPGGLFEADAIHLNSALGRPFQYDTGFSP